MSLCNTCKGGKGEGERESILAMYCRVKCDCTLAYVFCVFAVQKKEYVRLLTVVRVIELLLHCSIEAYFFFCPLQRTTTVKD